MPSKVATVLLIQFGLPVLAAVCREFLRTQPRSGWTRLAFGLASVLLFIIPAWVIAFITGHAPHGTPVDWYLMLCLFSFGSVPVGVAAIVYLISSTLVEPFVRLTRFNEVSDEEEPVTEGPMNSRRQSSRRDASA